MVAQVYKILHAFQATLTFFVPFVTGASYSGFTPNPKERSEDDLGDHPGPSFTHLEASWDSLTLHPRHNPRMILKAILGHPQTILEHP